MNFVKKKKNIDTGPSSTITVSLALSNIAYWITITSRHDAALLDFVKLDIAGKTRRIPSGAIARVPAICFGKTGR